jgi:hypothetical protein
MGLRRSWSEILAEFTASAVLPSVRLAFLCTSVLLLSMTLTAAASWLIPPRPPTNRLLRLLGGRLLVASVTAILVILFLLLAISLAEQMGATTWLTDEVTNIEKLPSTLPMMATFVGVSVALVGTRRGRKLHKAPHWRDRLSRVVGYGWILTLPVGLFTVNPLVGTLSGLLAYLLTSALLVYCIQVREPGKRKRL